MIWSLMVRHRLQLDGLGHMGEAGEFYNRNQGKDFSSITGLTKMDISQDRQWWPAAS